MRRALRQDRSPSDAARSARRPFLGAFRFCPRARVRATPRKWTRARSGACRSRARLQEKIVESRPVGLDADQPGQSLARLGERPDLARFEADSRQRVALGLPRVSGEQVVEIGLVGDAARRVDGRFRLSPGEEIAAHARPAHQMLARLADRGERAQPLRETLGQGGSVQFRRLRGQQEGADET